MSNAEAEADADTNANAEHRHAYRCQEFHLLRRNDGPLIDPQASKMSCRADRRASPV